MQQKVSTLYIASTVSMEMKVLSDTTYNLKEGYRIIHSLGIIYGGNIVKMARSEPENGPIL